MFLYVVYERRFKIRSSSELVFKHNYYLHSYIKQSTLFRKFLYITPSSKLAVGKLCEKSEFYWLNDDSLNYSLKFLYINIFLCIGRGWWNTFHGKTLREKWVVRSEWDKEGFWEHDGEGFWQWKDEGEECGGLIPTGHTWNGPLESWLEVG